LLFFNIALEIRISKSWWNEQDEDQQFARWFYANFG